MRDTTLSRYATNYRPEYWHRYEEPASLPAVYRKADRISRNFNLRNLQLRARVCVHKRTAQTNRAACGFIRVCVVGVGKNSVAQFRPSPGDDAAGPSPRMHIYTNVSRNIWSLLMQFPRRPKKRPPTSCREEATASELVVTNVPRQNSRPQILPVKWACFLFAPEKYASLLFKQLQLYLKRVPSAALSFFIPKSG